MNAVAGRRIGCGAYVVELREPTLRDPGHMKAEEDVARVLTDWVQVAF